MKKLILLLAAATMLSGGLRAQDRHIVLWDNATAPTSNEITEAESEFKPGEWKNTQKAEMWVYKAGANATGQAVVYFPGGGYTKLAVGNGHASAKWFAQNGITAAVVKYRLPNGHGEVPLDDAQEALRVMRSLAGEMGFDPAKVGVAGTSAGGHLAGCMGTIAQNRAAFMVLIYPVVSADTDKWHKGSFVALVGAENAETPAAQEYSIEKKIDAQTPPTILLHSDDDKLVPAVNSTLFYENLKKHGIRSSLYIFPSGGHGWGMNPRFRYYDPWRTAVLDWLSTLK